MKSSHLTYVRAWKEIWKIQIKTDKLRRYKYKNYAIKSTPNSTVIILTIHVHPIYLCVLLKANLTGGVSCRRRDSWVQQLWIAPSRTHTSVWPAKFSFTDDNCFVFRQKCRLGRCDYWMTVSDWLPLKMGWLVVLKLQGTLQSVINAPLSSSPRNGELLNIWINIGLEVFELV